MGQFQKDSNGQWILPPGWRMLDAPEPQAMPAPTAQANGPDIGNPITDALQGITGAAAQGLQMTGLFGGSPLERPGWLPKAVAQTVVPQTPTELGIWVATLPMGPGAGSVIGRTARMAVGGAMGGALGENGSTGFRGALQGGLSGLTGEAINKLGKMVTYVPWVKKMAQQDQENVGKVLYDMVPMLGKVESADDFQSTFSRVYGAQRLSRNYDEGVKAIGAAVGGPVTVPAWVGKPGGGSGIPNMPALSMITGQQGDAELGYQVPFEVAIDKVRGLREDARRMFKAQPVDASALNAKADFIEENALKSIPPELQAKYTDLKTQYAKGRGMLAFFDPKMAARQPAEGVLNDPGWLDVEKLQKRFKAQGLGTREALYSAAEVAQFQDALFRGADSNSRLTDMSSDTPMHIRFHKMGFSIPLAEAMTREAQFVGNTPRRGNLSPTISSLLGIGIQNQGPFADRLSVANTLSDEK